MPPPTNPDVDYERSDADPRWLAAIAGGVFAGVVGLLVVLRFAYPLAVGDQGGKGPRRPLPPQPRLQQDPASDVAETAADETARLAAVEWVDRPAGRVRIPVDEAMRRVARSGLPGWTKAAP